MRRVNVSIDTLDPDAFRFITRHGDVEQVKRGIFAARDAGLKVKINAVALRGVNEDTLGDLLTWCGQHGFDLTVIETMPLGEIEDDRTDRFLPLTQVLDRLGSRFTLSRDAHRTGGPARYWRVGEFGTRLGLISPLTANFCDGCNRVRLTTEGKLFMCLGHDDQVDLKTAFREGGLVALDERLDEAMLLKPRAHDFQIGRGAAPAVSRHMSVTGG